MRTTWAGSSSDGRSRRRWRAPFSAFTRSIAGRRSEPKIATRGLTAEYERSGALPAEAPLYSDGDVALFADATERGRVERRRRRTAHADVYLAAHVARLADGDYLALLAYVEMNEAHERALQAIRTDVRDTRGVATCVQFGPRFLHSTGQGYKGGPNRGVFLQVTCDDEQDLPVPGQKYTFGVVKAAQARGDFTVLSERDRRALRVHLGPDVAAGLSVRALRAALWLGRRYE